MWQNIIAYVIVALVALVAGRKLYRMLTGRSSGCGGCSGKASCPGGQAPLRPLPGSGCGCGCGR
jgi:hypothetical protein